jgi:hypothetical protein
VVDEASLEHVESAEESNGTVINGADDHKLNEGKGYRGIEETIKDQPPVEASRRRPRTDSDLDSSYAEAMREISRLLYKLFPFQLSLQKI